MQMTRKGAIRLVGGLMAALIGLAGPGMANEEIEKRAKDPNTWPAPGRDNKLTRHSPLKDINTDNVTKLQMSWSQSTGALRGHEGQPLVIDDVGGAYPSMVNLKDGSVLVVYYEEGEGSSIRAKRFHVTAKGIEWLPPSSW